MKKAAKEPLAERRLPEQALAESQKRRLELTELLREQEPTSLRLENPLAWLKALVWAWRAAMPSEQPGHWPLRVPVWKKQPEPLS